MFELDEQEQVFVCPKCCVFKWGYVIEECPYCKIVMIDTGITSQEEYNMGISKHRQQALEQFCYSSPLYSPEDEAKNALYEKKRIMESNAEHSRKIREAKIPKCPTCQSTNIRHIGGGERAMSVIGLGLFSGKIGKNYECLNCKARW